MAVTEDNCVSQASKDLGYVSRTWIGNLKEYIYDMVGGVSCGQNCSVYLCI